MHCLLQNSVLYLGGTDKTNEFWGIREAVYGGAEPRKSDMKRVEMGENGYSLAFGYEMGING
jgi:hypothetical protein